MTLSVVARVTLKDDDPKLKDLRRLVMAGEKSGTAMRRVLYRYVQLMDNIPPSPGDVVRDLGECLVSRRPDLIGRLEYPSKDELLEAIENSPIPQQTRYRLKRYIEVIGFPEYAKLMEAVELMYRA